MTGCLEFRRRVGAEPSLSAPDLDAHRSGCAACARWQDELRGMDALMKRALAVDAARLALPRARATGAGGVQRRWFAIAASLVAGIAVGLVLLTSAPRESVAREVMDHVAHEPVALAATVPVAPAAIAGALDSAGARLRPDIGDVTFAARCVHQGHVVPHLVVQRPQGKVTVLLLGHRKVDGPVRFEEQGFAGVILPAPRGSIAIVGQDPVDLEGVARQVFDAVDWGDAPAAG